MPAGTDADRAQVWPRRAFYQFCDRGVGRVLTYRWDRPNGVTVALSSEQPPIGLRWSARLAHGDIDVDIDPTLRAVFGFHDAALSYALDLDAAAKPEECLPAGRACERAALYLQATGIDLSQFVIDYVSLTWPPNAHSAAATQWWVSFARVWQGVPYWEQGINVCLDARWGRLLGFGTRMTATPPASTVLSVAPEKARDIARQHATAHAIAYLAEPTQELWVVMPTNIWSVFPGAGPLRVDVHSRLAWVVRGPAVWRDDGVERRVDVWVDAETGAVVGGQIATPFGRKPPRVVKPLDLGPAERVDLASVRAAAAGEPGALSLTPGGKGTEALRFYGALAGTGSAVAKKPVAFAADVRLVATLKGGRRLELAMDTKAGLLRSADGRFYRPGATLWALAKALVAPQAKPR